MTGPTVLNSPYESYFTDRARRPENWFCRVPISSGLMQCRFSFASQYRLDTTDPTVAHPPAEHYL